MPDLTRVVVLGTGRIGTLVTQLLAASGDYAVTAVDAHARAAEAAVRGDDDAVVPNATALAADFSQPDILADVVAGQDYVVSCAPYFLNVAIAEAAARAGAHYLDLTEDVRVTQAVRAMADGAATAFIPQCGLAPGFISIVAGHLARDFEALHSVKLRVGALPIYPNNRLMYNLTWSTDGLINEYGNPCEAIVDGRLASLEPLEGYERFSLDGVEYEAFNTSGGLGTLCEGLLGKVKHLDYKTIRYPGHRDIIALLMNDLGLNHDRATLKRIFESSLPHTNQDVVVVMVSVVGQRRGELAQETIARKIYAADINGRRWGAIQLTTAGGLCAALDLHRAGALPAKGFVRQEDVAYADFMANRFGRLYDAGHMVWEVDV
ncbi:MAG: saccharopine dehydrogenase C-terminal domain-containing protein [Ardenticatenales bacterium]